MKRNAAVLLLVASFSLQPVHAQEFAAQADPAEAGRINARLAIEYMKQGQLAVARDKIEKALRENPKDAGVQMSAGIVFERLEKPGDAEDHYREALRIDSTNPDVQNAFGAFLCGNGKTKAGEAMFLKAAKNPLYQTPQIALTNAGVCARQAGELDKAEEYLRQAIAQPTSYPEALVQLAGVSFERGKYLQARAFLQRYLAGSKGSAAVLLLGFQVEKALGDSAAMADYAARLRAGFPRSPEATVLDQLMNKGHP